MIKSSGSTKTLQNQEIKDHTDLFGMENDTETLFVCERREYPLPTLCSLSIKMLDFHEKRHCVCVTVVSPES